MKKASCVLIRFSVFHRWGFGLTTLVFLGAWGSLTFAGVVTKNTDNKTILMDFEGEQAPSPKDKVYVLDQNTRAEIGIVQVVKVKGARALGRLVRGKAKPGDITDLAQSRTKRDEDREPADDSNRSRAGARRQGGTQGRQPSWMRWGLGANFVYSSLFLKNELGEGSLSGNGFGFRGSLDANVNRNFSILGSLSLHPFNVSSETAGFTYNAAVNFLSFEGVGRFLLDKNNEGLWLGGGMAYLLPMSSNADAGKVESQIAIMGSAGFNIPLSTNYFTLKGDFLYYVSDSGSSGGNIIQFVLGGLYFF